MERYPELYKQQSFSDKDNPEMRKFNTEALIKSNLTGGAVQPQIREKYQKLSCCNSYS